MATCMRCLHSLRQNAKNKYYENTTNGSDMWMSYLRNHQNNGARLVSCQKTNKQKCSFILIVVSPRIHNKEHMQPPTLSGTGPVAFHLGALLMQMHHSRHFSSTGFSNKKDGVPAPCSYSKPNTRELSPKQSEAFLRCGHINAERRTLILSAAFRNPRQFADARCARPKSSPSKRFHHP